MKVFNLSLVFISIIIIILCILNISYNNCEGFVNYDQNKEENCLDYIKTKNWDIEYGMSYTNTDKDQLIKQQHIKDRSDIISRLQAIKISNSGKAFSYIDSCILPKDILTLYNTDETHCNIEGKVMGNNIIDNFGRKSINNSKVHLHTLDEFKKVSDFNVNEMKPNNGCMLDSRDKDNFYKTIDDLISIRKFERDNLINMYEVEKNIAHGKTTNTSESDKINELNSYLDKVNLTDSCRNITTIPTNNNNGDFREFDKHDISCGPNEVLQQVKLNSTTIPFKKIRYYLTRKNGLLVSTKDENSMKLINFLKVNPSVKFIIKRLELNDSNLNSNLVYDSTQIYSYDNNLEKAENNFIWIIYSDGQILLPEDCIADIDIIIGNGKKMFFTARCCSINTNIGDNARFVKVADEESTKIVPISIENRWNPISLYNPNANVITGPANCKNNKLVNKFKMISEPNNFKYKYTCSDIQNDIVKIKPNKKINWDCSTHYTDENNMISGKTTSMQDMNVECPPQSYINDIKLEKNDLSYRMKFKCCKPLMHH